MIKTILPFRLKVFLKSFLASSSPEEKEFVRIKKIPRYTSGTFINKDRSLFFPDSASFLFTYDEIFKKEVYFFKTENTAPYIIDGGANIGLSVCYFKQLYPESRVVAFEPDEEIFRYLEKNTHGLNHVELVKKGLWSDEGELAFEQEGADAGRIQKDSTYKIKVDKLSNYLDRPVDFLKLDIEGAEFEVIRESYSLLSNVNKLFIEYHNYQGQPQNLHLLLSILSENSFEYFITAPGVSNNPFKKVKLYNGMNFQVNIFAQQAKK